MFQKSAVMENTLVYELLVPYLTEKDVQKLISCNKKFQYISSISRIKCKSSTNFFIDQWNYYYQSFDDKNISLLLHLTDKCADETIRNYKIDTLKQNPICFKVSHMQIFTLNCDLKSAYFLSELRFTVHFIQNTKNYYKSKTIAHDVHKLETIHEKEYSSFKAIACDVDDN